MRVDTDQVKEILLRALELAPADRTAFLAAATDDEAIRRHVEGLIVAHELAGDLMAHPTMPVRDPLLHLPDDSVRMEGTAVGAYRLVRKLGEGGFGAVYLAEQQEPVRRDVAVKILKAGMDTVQVVSRFQTERRAMALMDHPGIARVFDAGTTDRGRPYFVMEYVPGEPVTAYCDRRRLDVRRRLELFRAICMAVQHAHQKGVIHRDLKPTNVLVMEVDGAPVPKIIDFGIAKAVAGDLSEFAVTTQAAQLLGTPEYMAPEQASLGGMDVDTRTDVYSLGVLLYELLVGAAPFDRIRLRGLGVGELERVIRDEEPPRPSSRLASMGDEAIAIAMSRRADPARMRRELRGDLDWIVMRAIEKDRARRYPTANALADDVRRHLADLPVDAGPPAMSYRLRKFVRRHRTAMVTAALLAFALIVTVLVSLRAAAIARHALDEAVAATDAASRSAYSAGLLAASTALRIHDAASAARHLELVPAELRGWEWSYLRGITDRSQWTYGPMAMKTEALAVSGDGRFVALAAPDHAVVLLDAATGEERARLEGHTAQVFQLAFSPDGRRLFSGAVDGSLRAWDIESAALLGVLEGHTDRIDALAIGRDGNALVSAGWDGRVCAWDITTLERRLELDPAGVPMHLVAVDHGLTRIAAAGWDQRLRLWDAQSGELLLERPMARPSTALTGAVRFAPGRLTVIAFAPTGDLLAVGTADGMVRLLDARTGEERHAIDVGLRYVRDLRINASGDLLAAGLIDGAIATWRLPDGTPMAGIERHDDDVRAIRFTPDDRLVTVAFDNTVRVLDPHTGRSLATLEGHAASVYQVELPNDGSFAVTRSDDRTVRRWDVSPGAADVLITHQAPVTDVAIAPDGMTVVSGSSAGDVSLHRLTTASRFMSTELRGSAVLSLALSPDGDLLATGRQDGSIRIVPVHRKAHQVMIETGGAAPARLLFAPRARRLAAVLRDGTVRLYEPDPIDPTMSPEPTPWRETQRFELAGDTLHGADFDPSGERIVTISERGVLHVWDPGTGRLERTIPVPGAEMLRAIAVAPDGRRAAVGGYGRVVHIVDLDSGQLLQTCLAHGGAVMDLAWLPDGSRVVSASTDRTLRVWDPDRGEAVCILFGHEDELRTLAVASDGSVVVSGGSDAVVRIWRGVPVMDAAPVSSPGTAR